MKVIVQDLAVEYKDEGSGKTLLFLHGWKSNLDSFDKIVSLLLPHYRVIRLDLPGFGKTDIPKETWDLDKYISFVVDFIQKLNIKVDVIIGHSFGGRIIIKGESKKVFKVEKIVLIGSAGIAKRKTFRNYFFKVLTKTGKFITAVPPLSLIRESLRKKIYSFTGNDYINAGPLKDTFLKIINEDLTHYATKITTPSILIWGINDTETPVTDGRKLSTLIKNSSFHIVENSGHFVHVQKTEEIIELIKKFI